jgi:hypothetical protein
VRPARFELATYGFVVRRSIRAELRAHRTIGVLSLTLIFLLVKAVTDLLMAPFSSPFYFASHALLPFFSKKRS